MQRETMDSTSIFTEYYADTSFVDRFANDPKDAVDVIIPIIHSNELWKANLKSLYREIPINRLLIGDGGCIDDSIKIVKEFPRVQVFNHTEYKSLGYSIKKLIEEVETEWFIYPHSDVYLPEGWFDTMKGHQAQYDWFGCPMRVTVLAEYDHIDHIRPYAGSQMGRKAAFVEGLKAVDDDYVYRQEDFVFAQVVENYGGKVGAIEDTFHYHQMMRKDSKFGRKIKGVSFNMELADEEKIREYETQARGVVKYLEPNTFQRTCVEDNVAALIEAKRTTFRQFKQWTRKVNPKWSKHIKYNRIGFILFKKRARAVVKKIIGNG